MYIKDETQLPYTKHARIASPSLWLPNQTKLVHNEWNFFFVREKGKLLKLSLVQKLSENSVGVVYTYV